MPAVPVSACPVCASPVEGYDADTNTHCSLYCAVVGGEPVDGLDDPSVAEVFLDEARQRIEALPEDDQPLALRQDVARLLRWLIADGRLDAGDAALSASLRAWLAPAAEVAP